jgi:hypothetical protein
MAGYVGVVASSAGRELWSEASDEFGRVVETLERRLAARQAVGQGGDVTHQERRLEHNLQVLESFMQRSRERNAQSKLPGGLYAPSEAAAAYVPPALRGFLLARHDVSSLSAEQLTELSAVWDAAHASPERALVRVASIQDPSTALLCVEFFKFSQQTEPKLPSHE